MSGRSRLQQRLQRLSVQRWMLLTIVVGVASLTALTAGSAIAADRAARGERIADSDLTDTSNDSVASGRTVYLGGEDGQVLAFDVAGGTVDKVWETDVGGTIGKSTDPFVLGHPAPTVVDGTVYITAKTREDCPGTFCPV